MFLRSTLSAAVAPAFLTTCETSLVRAVEHGEVLADTATLCAASEPGERLTLFGRVFRPDGTSPCPDVVVYAYNTDARGLYSNQGPPRIRGLCRTNSRGEFEIHTVRPAPYPGRTTPAHVHIQCWGNGYAPQWTEEIMFTGDPLLTERELVASAALERFRHVISLASPSTGVWRGEFAIRLKARGDRFEANIRHGLDLYEARFGERVG